MTNKTRKTDRRTLYTQQVIKDALLELLASKTFAQIRVTELCRQAEITRSTFYLHYDSLNDLLNQVIDDALQLTPLVTDLDVSDVTAMIPVCQRFGDNPKYRHLMLDTDLSEYIIGRIIHQEKGRMVPEIMMKTGLDTRQAETLFIYILHGSFAVNRRHNFQKDAQWQADTEMLQKFVQAGYNQLHQ